MYLDPHYVRSYCYNLEEEYKSKPEKFHCDHVRTIQLSELDPTISFGFLIGNFDSLKTFTQKIEEINSKVQTESNRVITIFDDAPEPRNGLTQSIVAFQSDYLK
jgi:hypothetical protein